MMMKRRTYGKKHINHKINWYIYMLDLGDGIRKSKHYGKKKAFYIGIAKDLGVIINENVTEAISIGYTTRCWHLLPKKLVYVEYPIFGNEFEAMQYEKKLKALSRSKKEDLVNSDKNILLRFFPIKKLIIVKGENGDMERAIYMKRRENV